MYKFNKLDAYQKKAVCTDKMNTLVVSAPGSGKTTIIIERIFYLIERKRINPLNIIVITFTRAAAENMKKRYESICGKRKMPFFGTFHSLFYKIVSKYKRDISIIENYQAQIIIKREIKNYLEEINDEKVKEILNYISIYKINEFKFKNMNMGIGKELFLRCYHSYENYKHKNNLLDFDDLQICCKNLFTSRNDVLKKYIGIFKYMLVDEFQDCDLMQIKLLQMLNKNNQLFAVGDDDQSIFSFRGSNPEFMVNFNSYFYNGKKIFLKNNYRNPNNILNVSKKLINCNVMRNCKDIFSKNKCNGKIKVVCCSDEKEQINLIINSIKKLVESKKYEYNNIAILYRTNAESSILTYNLLKNNMPFKVSDNNYCFYDSFVCKDLLAYLKLGLDNSDKESFIRIINKPFRYISKIAIEHLKRYRIKESCFDILRGLEDINVIQLKTIDELEKKLNKLKSMNTYKAINFILNKLCYWDYLKKYMNKLNIDLEQIHDFISQIEEDSIEFKDISSFIVYVDNVKKSKIKHSNNNDFITLSTIHGIKGMEFKNVFIINCVDGNIPNTNNVNLEEERRLFYVGITRVIENLFLIIPKNLKGKAKMESRFIEESGLNNTIIENTKYKKGKFVCHKVFGKGEIVNINNKTIVIKFKNKVEREFDISILQRNMLINDA